MPPTQTLTKTDQSALLTALSPHTTTPHKHYTTDRNRLIALLMLDAGLRASELVHLQFANAYFANLPRSHLEIPDAIAKYNLGGSIPISPRLADALRTYAPTATMILARLPHPTHPLLFTTLRQTRLSRRTIHRIISHAGHKALGRPVFPHILRHTFIDTLRTVTDLPTVQLLARHKHLSSTQSYTHPTTAQAQDAIARMSTPQETTP